MTGPASSRSSSPSAMCFLFPGGGGGGLSGQADGQLVRPGPDLTAGRVEPAPAEAERRRRDVERRDDTPAEVADRRGDARVTVLELVLGRGVAELPRGGDPLRERVDVARRVRARRGQVAVAEQRRE